MYAIIRESSLISQIPKKVKKKGDYIRFEAILQDVDTKNRNKRIYRKAPLQEGIAQEQARINEGTFLGELDHPVAKNNPVRQCTVLFERASHRILELGWDGNNLVGVLETLGNTVGRNLRDLALQLPIGFSFRGMGEVSKTMINGEMCTEVVAPMKVITWDAVTQPSHAVAKLTRINEHTFENFNAVLNECCIKEENGMICTDEGICYLPNDFDTLVEKRIINLKKKYKI